MASSCLDRQDAVNAAQRQNAKFEQAQTLLARGRVGLTQGWEGAAAEVSAAQQALVELRAGFALAQNVVPK